MKKGKSFLKLLLLGMVMMQFSSCSLTLPSFNSKNQSSEISINTVSQIESLKKEDYNVLRTTTGSASTARCYLLFFRLGRFKTNSELYENAYYDAVDNLPNADALILPRQQIKRFTIPLILFTYSKRKVTVTGVGISVKDKIIENIDSDVPFTVAENYCLRNTLKNKQLSSPKITSQMEFEKLFEKLATMDENIKPTSIDFSKQYVIAIIGKAARNNPVIYANNLKVQGNEVTLYYRIEEGEKQSNKIQPALILIVDKKYQGSIRLKCQE